MKYHNSKNHLVLLGVILAFISGISIRSNSVEIKEHDVKINESALYYLCKYGSDVRTIRVELKGQSCKAYYTKAGVDQVVGKSGTPQVCNEVVEKIKINLEKGNWSCKSINDARISSIEE